MKLGFFGDSYCADIPKGDIHDTHAFSWPYTVVKTLKAEITNECISGDTFWHTYQYLTESIEMYDILIICVSDPIRVPNHYRIPTITTAFNSEVAKKRMGEELTSEFEEYLTLHTKFQSREFRYAAQIGVLHKLDELIGKHKKKTLILPSFENSLQGYSFKNASVANINLNEDVKKKVSIKPELYSNNYPKIANHLQPKENDVLAEAVVDFINNDYKLEFDLKKYFNYLYN